MPSRIAALSLAAALLLAACGAGSGSPRPTGSAGVTPSASSPVAPGVATPTSPGLATPAADPWPTGWDAAFCALWSETVVMQELAVDIGRALDDNARVQARLLAAELARTASGVREDLAALPVWPPAAPLEAEMVALLDLADQMAARYERHFATNRSNPLNAAIAAGGRMNEVVPRLLAALATLSAAGLSCPGSDFDLEAPPAP